MQVTHCDMDINEIYLYLSESYQMAQFAFPEMNKCFNISSPTRSQYDIKSFRNMFQSYLQEVTTIDTLIEGLLHKNIITNDDKHLYSLCKTLCKNLTILSKQVLDSIGQTEPNVTCLYQSTQSIH